MATVEIAGRVGLQSRWWIVAASLLGNVVGPGPSVIFVMNVFMVPVTTELHWTRGMFSSSLLASAIQAPIMTPLFGFLLDRYGIRKVALPTAFLYGLALSSLSLLSANHFWLIYLMVAASAGFGACFGPIVYSKAITAWFDHQRGIALGIATCGVGLGTFVMPAIAQYFVAHYGWRAAYLAVGVTTFVVCFLVIVLVVREPAGYVAHMRAAHAHPAEGPQPFGISWQAALRRYQFWVLSLIFLLEGTACNGILSGHFVPLLIDRGYSPVEAVAFLSASGLAAMGSRIVVGLGLDFVNGPIFSAIVMLLPALGVELLLTHANGPVPLYAALCFGLAIGAEVDMMGFFVSRYFGRRSFGAIYGIVFALFAVGIGIGPQFLGFVFDRYHSYDPTLKGFLVALVVAALLFLPLGRYTYPKGAEAPFAPQRP
jgi:MFS family permease